MTEIEEKKPSDELNQKISKFANSFVAIIETLDKIDADGKQQGYTREEMRDMVGPYLEEKLERQGISMKDFLSFVDKMLYGTSKRAPSNKKINNQYRLKRMIKASKKADKQ